MATADRSDAPTTVPAMQILVVGGTAFVGRHFVSAALAAGHQVTLLHRGRTGAELFPDTEQLIADRDDDLSVLTGRQFDATVDTCAYLPRQVSSLAAALEGRGGHHLFVSTVSVYAGGAGGTGSAGSTESAPLLPAAGDDVDEVTGDTYGPLKVACEQVAADRYGERLVVVRPTYVVGPYDHTWRFPWWVRRIAAGGEVLAPGPHDAPIQVIDARDQASFMTGLLERGVPGVFHTVSPAPPFGFGDLLEAVAARVAPPGTSLRWVDAETLLERSLPDQALPLWAGGDPGGDACDPGAAIAEGLAVRPLAQTIAETLEWVNSTDGPPSGIGLSREEEADILSFQGPPTG
jgi:2'-hydroxyisoflavone reductase